MTAVAPFSKGASTNQQGVCKRPFAEVAECSAGGGTGSSGSRAGRKGGKSRPPAAAILTMRGTRRMRCPCRMAWRISYLRDVHLIRDTLVIRDTQGEIAYHASISVAFIVETIKIACRVAARPARRTHTAVAVSSRLRESYIFGTKCPAFDEPVKAGEASSDGLGAGRLISARSISRPAAQPGHDPGEPGQTPLRVRVLQLFSSPFELSVERRQRRLVCRVRRVGQDLAGLAVPSNHDLHDPHRSDQRHHGEFYEPSRLRDLRLIGLHGGRFQRAKHLFDVP